MSLDEFEEEKLYERFKPILDKEVARAECYEYDEPLAKDIFQDFLYDHPQIQTAAELNNDHLRAYARKRIEEDTHRQD